MVSSVAAAHIQMNLINYYDNVLARDNFRTYWIDFFFREPKKMIIEYIF